MKKIIIIIVLILIVVGGGLFFFLGNRGTEKETGEKEQVNTSPSTTAQTVANDQTMIDCGQAQDPGCFMNRMNGCLPVTAKMMGSDGKTSIDITILGIENEKCHFQRKINNSIDLDCYFPKGTFNGNTLDQTFGNDKGLQKVVDDACSKPGW